MTTKNAIDTLSLSSLTMKANGDIVIPKGKVVEVQSHEELLNLPGKLHNLGTLRFLCKEASFEEFFNTGLVETSKDTFVLNVAKLRNHGVIKAPKVLKINSKSELSINPNGKEGTFEASESVEVRASSSIVAKKSTFLSEKVIFESEMGDVTVIAQRISGRVCLKGKDLTVETLEGDLVIESNEATGFVKVKAFTNLSIPPTSQSGDYAGAGTNVTGGPVSVTGTNGESIGIGADEALDVLALTAASGGIQASAGESLKITGNVTAELEIILSSNGSFDVTGDVKTTGQGNILLFAEGTLEVTGKVDSAAAVLIKNSDDKTDTGGDCTIKISGKTSGKDGNIIITAGNKISLGDVEITGTDVAGAIDIWPNRGFAPVQASDIFNLGGGGNNGCGSLSTSNTTGGGTAADTVVGGVKVQNGGTGGINVSSAAAISVTASQSKNGLIILSAQTGPVTLPGGTLSVDGASGQGAGYIIISAQDLTVADTILSASDSGSQTRHGVWIATRTLNGAKLTAKANGKGQQGTSFGADVLLLSQGSFIVNDTLDLSDLRFTVNFPNGVTGGFGEFLVQSGQIVVESNGDGNAVRCSGKNLKLNGGNVSVNCKGKNTFVEFAYAGGEFGVLDITSPVLSVIAEGVNSAGGGIVFKHKNISVSTSLTLDVGGRGNFSAGLIAFESEDQLIVNGNGGNLSAFGRGTGNGGIIRFLAPNSSQAMVLATFTAAANAQGTGNGGAIDIVGKTLDYDTVSFQAKGGLTSGNGNNITMVASEDVLIKGPSILDASARGTGDGGTISVSANGQLLKLDSTAMVVNALGGSTPGNGGNISFSAPATGATFTSKGTIRASAVGTGIAGSISATADNIDVQSGLIVAFGDQAGSVAGSINLTAQVDLKLSGVSVLSNGAAAGSGKEVNIKCMGNPGTIHLTAATVAAQGGQTNGHAGNVLVEAKGKVTLDNASTIGVRSLAGNNPGGMLTIKTDKVFECFGSTVTSDGAGTREGGLIDITALGMTVNGASFIRSNGGVTGPGGNITIKQPEITPGSGVVPSILLFTDTTRLLARGGSTSGAGGNIDINHDGGVRFDPETITSADGGGQVGSGGSNGGTIKIESAFVLGEIGAKITSNGKGAGNGGRIEFILDTAIDFEPEAEDVITAKGGLTGAGGEVIIDKSSDYIINKVIKVDAGANTDTNIFGGRLMLNEVPCRQFKTGFSTWPFTYWDKENPLDDQASRIATGANSLPPGFKSTLQAANVHIYCMRSYAEAWVFAGVSNPDSNAGGVSFIDQKVSNVFSSTPNKDLRPYFESIMIHELAHQLNWLWGDLSGTQSTFTTAYDFDVQELDIINCGELTFEPNCNSITNTQRFTQIVGSQFNPDEVFCFLMQVISDYPVDDNVDRYTFLASTDPLVFGGGFPLSKNYLQGVWDAGHP